MSTDHAPLTRKEVETWPALGPMALKAQRVLTLFDALDKLGAFKTYVHQRLDGAGIAADPNPEENARHGCRIEGRLDVLIGERDEARATAEIHAHALDKARAEVEELRRELELSRRELASGREAMRHASSEIDTATTQVAAIIAEREELKGQVAYLADALWRDDVGMSKALGQIRAHIRGRAWVLEGRGPLEWNDDTYREEAGLAMRPALELAEAALSSSGDLLHPTLRDIKAKAKAWIDGVRFEAFAQLGAVIVKAFEVKDSDMVIIQGLTLEPDSAHRAIESLSKMIGKTGRNPIVVGLSPLEPISVDIMRPAQREHLRDELNRHMGLERLTPPELLELRTHVAELLEGTSTSGDNRLGELIERLLGSPLPSRPELDAARVEVNEWWMRLVRGELDLVRYAAIRHRDAADPFTLAAFDAIRAHDERIAELGPAALLRSAIGKVKATYEVGPVGVMNLTAEELAAWDACPLPDAAEPVKKVLPACSSTEHPHCSRCGHCEERGEQCICYAR
jgi:hypothetical protein